MDNPAFAALAKVARPHGPVTLPGGSKVPVRSLTLGELDRLEREAEAAPEDERDRRLAVLIAAHALCDDGGEPLTPRPRAEDLAALGDVFTGEQFRAIVRAASGSRDDAKNS